MKTMYKVIVAMMIMAITAAPAVAGNKVDKNAHPDKKEMRMNDHKYDKKTDKKTDKKFDKRHDNKAAIEVISFKVSHKASKKKNFMAKVEAIRGVKEVKWNPRTSMITVTYDANKTSVRTIKAAVN